MPDHIEGLTAEVIRQPDNISRKLIQIIADDALGLSLRLYPRWSGAITRKPRSARGAIWFRQPYQNSGKP
jgi:hypothetical protein